MLNPKARWQLALVGAAIALLGPAAAALAEQPLREVIDTEIQAAWEREGVTPAVPASDAEFLRRAFLDLTGTVPTYEETAAFLESGDSDKRARLIDRLLDDPRYAVHQARVWDLLYFGRTPARNEARERAGFQRWLRGQFAENAPYDRTALQVLKAAGDTVTDGAPMYLLQYQNQPEEAAVHVAETFLGVQLQCARCHDHPFEDWTQLDFYGMAAFFARLEVVSVGREGNETKYVVGEKRTGDVLFSGPVTEQEPGKKGEPVGAKFLKGSALDEPPAPEGFEEPRRFPANQVPPPPDFSRKDALAEWIVSRDNPWFARATANRVWAQYLGRGLVHPVDDMTPSNPPSHPELLEALADGLIAHDFDLKWFIRELANSRTYQLSAAGAVEEAFPLWFERARVRPLSAEELAEAWRTVTGYETAHADQRKDDDPFWGLTSGYMLRFFGEPANGTGDFQGGLHEHLYLNNGQVRSLITTREGGLHHALTQTDAPWPERVERLFLTTLNRRPAPEETDRFVQHLAAEGSPSERLQEAIWVLITCSEFRFNH